MNINKLYWKALYYWIRYLNYNVIYRDKEDDEIWLSHKRKHSIVVFRKMSHLQEIRFDKSKLWNDLKKYNNSSVIYLNLMIFIILRIKSFQRKFK